MTTQRRKLGVKPRGACKKHSPPPKKRANASIASRPKLKRREDCSQMPNAASRRRARTYGSADVLKQTGHDRQRKGVKRCVSRPRLVARHKPVAGKFRKHPEFLSFFGLIPCAHARHFHS